jgi:hypothetical protein
MRMAQSRSYGTITWYGTVIAHLQGSGTITRVLHSYTDMAQLHRYGTDTCVWHNYVGMAQLHGMARV